MLAADSVRGTADHAGRALLFFIPLTIFVAFVLLSFAAFPGADDYCYAVKTKQLGFWGSQAYWYQYWSGRFTATVLMAALAWSGDIARAYAPALISAHLVAFTAIVAFISSLMRQCSLRAVLSVALCAYVIFLGGLAEISHYAYWFMGVADYAAGNIALLILLTVGLRYEPWNERSGWRAVVLLMLGALASVFAAGTNEITLVTVVVLHATALVVALKRRTGSAWFWASLLLLTLIAAFASVLAPGNFARLASIETEKALRPNGFVAALLLVPWYLLRIVNWMVHPLIWISAAIVLLASRSQAERLLYRDGVFVRTWLFVPLGWLALLFGLTAIGFVVNRYPLPERAETTVWFAFLVGWYPSFVILSYLAAGKANIARLVRFRKALLLALVIAMLGAPHVFEAFKDLAYRAIRYRHEMDSRLELIRKAALNGVLDLKVPSLSRVPRTVHVTEVTTDPSNFRNSCLAEYYGLRTIALGVPEGVLP